MPQDAALLMGLIASLYLADSALLLHVNEGVICRGGGGRWSVSLGSREYRLQGKPVFLPNPLYPHRPLFRLAWRFDGADAEAREDWDARALLLRPLAPLVWGMACSLFLLLPLGFFTALGDGALAAAIVLLYGSIIAALTWVWRRQAEFKLGGRQFAALAFEALACSPFALNIVRKLSLRIPAGEDLVSVARRLQGPADWRETRAMLVARLDEAIEAEVEDSSRAAGMAARRRALTAD